MVVTVRNLANLLSVQTYTCTPREAVVAAHAQSFNDYNTWNYKGRYDRLIVQNSYTVACGTFWAFTFEATELVVALRKDAFIHTSPKGYILTHVATGKSWLIGTMHDHFIASNGRIIAPGTEEFNARLALDLTFNPDAYLGNYLGLWESKLA